MIREMIDAAMRHQDDLVLSMDYVDAQGKKTSRIVSPIRFVSGNRFLGLCLCRCEPRQFDIQRCSNFALQNAANYVMPVAML